MLLSIVRAAEENTIVTCNGLDCTVCSLFQVVANLFTMLLYTSAAVAIFFVAVGGLIYIAARGRDSWMSQAKKTILWAVFGFAFVLLAHLSVRVSFMVMGANNDGLFDKFECDGEGGGAIKLPKVPTKKITEMSSDIEKNGGGGGVISENTSESELAGVFKKISDENMLIYALEESNQRKPIIALTKTSHWFDWDLIKKASSSKTSGLLLKEVQAAEEGSSLSLESEESYRQMAFKIVAGLVKNKQKVVTIVTAISKSSLLSGISVNDLYVVLENFSVCAGSGGTWYRYSDSCSFEKGSCGTVNCVSSSESFINGCKCPSGTCRQGSECVEQKK